MGRFQIYLNFNQLIRLRSHMERLHGVELMEAMAGFHTFDKVMILLLGKRINEIHRGLIDRKQIGRGKDPDIRNGRRRRTDTGAVAVNRHAAHHVKERNVAAEVITDRFAGIREQFQKVVLRGPGVPVRRRRTGNAMHLTLADLT